jgi:putative endonuclease
MNEAGVRAEELSAQFLSRAGLRIIARNWRCRHGEIDLIAEDGATLVFAEVRLRKRGLFGGAAESVTVAKRARLVAAASLYAAGKRERPMRFDVLLLESLVPLRIEWIRNAFAE